MLNHAFVLYLLTHLVLRLKLQIATFYFGELRWIRLVSAWGLSFIEIWLRLAYKPHLFDLRRNAEELIPERRFVHWCPSTLEDSGWGGSKKLATSTVGYWGIGSGRVRRSNCDDRNLGSSRG